MWVRVGGADKEVSGVSTRGGEAPRWREISAADNVPPMCLRCPRRPGRSTSVCLLYLCFLCFLRATAAESEQVSLPEQHTSASAAFCIPQSQICFLVGSTPRHKQTSPGCCPLWGGDVRLNTHVHTNPTTHVCRRLHAETSRGGRRRPVT